MKLFFTLLFYQVRFQMYLISHLYMLILIYHIDVHGKHEQFLISQYSPILHVVLHSQSDVLGFHI